jgi:hypothetical protein
MIVEIRDLGVVSFPNGLAAVVLGRFFGVSNRVVWGAGEGESGPVSSLFPVFFRAKGNAS